MSETLFDDSETAEAKRKSFNVPLSPSGSFPATHYGGSAWLSDDDAERWSGISGVDHWLMDDKGAVVSSTRDAGESPSFDDAVAALSLTLIDRTDI